MTKHIEILDMSDLKTPLDQLISMTALDVSEMSHTELVFCLGMAQSVIKILQDDNEARKLDGELLVSLTHAVREIADKAVEGDFEFITAWANGPFMMGLNHKDEPKPDDPEYRGHPYLKCDGCGKSFFGKGYQVMDENFNVQPGLIHCAHCFK